MPISRITSGSLPQSLLLDGSGNLQLGVGGPTIGPSGLTLLDGTLLPNLSRMMKPMFRQCSNFNDFKLNWKFSGTVSGTPPTTLSGDSKLSDFHYGDATWSDVDISTDYVPDVNTSHWYVRKIFYLTGSFNISATVDDNWCWTLIPIQGTASVVLGDVTDVSGSTGTAVPSASVSNYTISVPSEGVYVFVGRGYEGGGGDHLLISSVDSGLGNIYVLR